MRGSLLFTIDFVVNYGREGVDCCLLWYGRELTSNYAIRESWLLFTMVRERVDS